ncbi:MAG: hypothetical protein A2W90_14720 [Bacteroidetes bacterium GWF2_42_66]|nr:MAG: hypothetical protein A2W89_04595 [Bacteroidetes bacterium GWE2_42_39]OFY46776.1 MAG: hypothetical protein A2W90_14720 [Bacteroidetes bacterium GWF2_42_66]HAZ04552.1 hypothetical protein [Marinilabiliales bacterium]HBL73815.1 hypothetical protein [Prolixibacteraceae bacterium]HCU63252.1 hypothetical protein [Prolixibacteraceae bacterium]
MNIPQHIQEKLDRLYSNRFLGDEELKSLEGWLNQIQSDEQTNQWLSSNWETAENIDVEISFDEIRRRIATHEKQFGRLRIQQWTKNLQRVAAILAIPLLIVSLWLILNRQHDSSSMVLATAKGEHTHVFLPDGSEVWLNVDSRLEYFTNYNAANRLLKLRGEGFFKVAKGKKFPFIVDMSGFQVKAIGTEFNISAYADDPCASIYMQEGIVELSYLPEGKKEQKFQMKAGDNALISSASNSVMIGHVSVENNDNWINGELSFHGESLDQVFRKTERWYNVTIDYNPNDFSNETFTVHLKKDESVNHLFEIIDQAIGINVKQNGKIYVISKK